MTLKNCLRLAALLLSVILVFVIFTPPRVAHASASGVVISQIYGGGGNSGATFKNDFIEIFNADGATVNLSGWSVQYASAAGSTWQVTSLSGSLAPGQYYLIQEAQGAAGTTNLPTPNAIGTINMSATAGKVALVSSTTPLSGACPTGGNIVDFAGYGTGTGGASCFEGAGAAPTLNNTTADFRLNNGLQDTDNNSADFVTGAPNPRNSVPSSSPAGAGAANPASVAQGGGTLLTITVTPGTNPASTGLAVTCNLSSIGGPTAQQFFDDGTHGDSIGGDNVFSFQATVSGTTSAGTKSLPATITDTQGRSGSATITLNVTAVSTSPGGSGAANPSSLQAGNATLLTVAVTPGTNPASTGIGVTGNLSSIGGSSAQQFFDDGTHGDVTAGDNVFSFQATVSSDTAPGVKSLPVSITDAQSRTGPANIAVTISPPPAPTTIKISQVYGGGGNSGSTYTNDFIEIFNQDSKPVDISSWSVQYNSAGATGTWQVTNLCAGGITCTIAPGHYYLVKESQGAGGTTALPAPDAVGVIAMSSTSAKVALVATTAPLSGACPAGSGIVDLVGYGAANCSETSPTPALTNTTAALRRGNGCLDTDNNGNDFVIIGPIPRNSSSPAQSCGGDPTQPSGLGTASPSSLDPSSNTLLTVKVTPATTPASTGLSVTADLTSIGGPASQPFFDDDSHGDEEAGDNIFSCQSPIGAFIPTGAKSILATITDAEGRTATAPITLTVQSPTCGVERWSVKTGTDPDAAQVDLNSSTASSIAELTAITPPAVPPDNARVTPVETTVYVVNATMTLYKKETDVDYHIVLQDEIGRTMIVEIPCPCCAGVSSPFDAGITNARTKFDARFTATPGFQTANVPVRVKGVAFFDFLHGQTGVAPNGIELHPVLDIDFTALTTTTLTSVANPSQYRQSVTFTATVTSGGKSKPTGKVMFLDSGNVIGSGTLDQNGQATFFTSALPVGSHSITASYEGDNTSAPSTSAGLTQVVNKADQAISFAPLSGKTFGDAPFNVNATASSGLAVTFQIQSGPATISGNLVTITGAGMVTITASQGGDGNYNPAPDVQQSFTVAKAVPTINVAGGTFTYDGQPHPATGSVVGINGENLGAPDFSYNGSSTPPVGAGSYAVVASFAGNTNYAPGSKDGASIIINKATPAITWSNPADIVYGTALSATQLNATASVPGTFTYSPASGTVLSAGAAQSLVADFTPADPANYNSTSQTVVINVFKANPSFTNLSSPTIVFGTASTALSGHIALGALVPTGSVAITLNGVTQNASIQANGNFSSTFATASLAPSTPPYTVTFSYGGDSNFNPASGSATFTVGYNIVALYDQTKAAKSGSTIPIKLEITDANGSDLSSANTLVKAVNIALVSTGAYGTVEDAGNSNPDNNFRFADNMYIFNLKTTGLATGIYNLYFSVGGDPTQHSVQFQIR